MQAMVLFAFGGDQHELAASIGIECRGPESLLNQVALEFMHRLCATNDALWLPDAAAVGDKPLCQLHQRSHIGDDDVRTIAIDRIGVFGHVCFGHLEAVEHAAREDSVVKAVLELGARAWARQPRRPKGIACDAPCVSRAHS